jgi:hypothetical protein
VSADILDVVIVDGQERIYLAGRSDCCDHFKLKPGGPPIAGQLFAICNFPSFVLFHNINQNILLSLSVSLKY